MERTYAGILGLTAFAATAVQGLLLGSPAAAVLQAATIRLAMFAVVGAVLGWLAARIVDDSVRSEVARELASRSEIKVSPGTSRRAAPGAP